MTEQRIWPPATPNPSNHPNLPASADLREKIIHALRQVYDPEIPVNLYDLGLIYKIDIDDATKRVAVLMTLTTPNCPEADALPGRVRQVIEIIPEVSEAQVEIVWEPPWDKSKMSDEAKLILGLE